MRAVGPKGVQLRWRGSGGGELQARSAPRCTREPMSLPGWRCGPDNLPQYVGPASGPTCDGEGGTGGLGAAGAGVFPGVLPAQVPKHQLRHVAPLLWLPALVSLQLQATLTPDHSGAGLRQLTPQAG